MSRARPSAPRFACLAAGALFLGLVTPALVAAAPQAPAIDPWRALTELRLHLAASGALGAKFRQSYVPAGFATGDEETGRVALALPDCLRWDYSEPYPKAYLLCGSRLHTWVTGEPVVSRAQVKGEQADSGLTQGLDPVKKVGELRALGWTSADVLRDDIPVTAFRFDGAEGQEYWMGLPNFYVITRYNRSAMCAMAVHQLSGELVAKRGRP